MTTHPLLCKCLKCQGKLDIPVAKTLVSESLVPGVVGVDTVEGLRLEGLRQRNTSGINTLPTSPDTTIATQSDDFPVWFYTGKNKPTDARKQRQIVREVKRLARKFAPEAMQTLYDIMADPSTNPGVRMKCAQEILDRTVGRTKVDDKGDEDTDSSEEENQVSESDITNLLDE